jgi:O-succinylbenzoate synthase
LCLKEWLAPELLGTEVHSGAALQERLAHVSGNNAGKAALDVAWWNLKAAQDGRPLAELLGSAPASNVPLGSVFDVQSSIDELIALVGQAIEAGHPSIGLKFRPGWGLEVVRAVRSALGHFPLWIDADGMCSLGQRDTFFRLEDFSLERIEQPLPFDDLVAHAMLQESLRTPIALDQSITGPARLEQAIDLVSCRQVRLNPQRLGGLTPTLALAAECRKANLPCHLAIDQQTSIGMHAALSLAAVGITTGPVDLEPLDPACGDLAGFFTPARNEAGQAEIPAAEITLPSPAPSRVSLERFLMAQAMLAE